MDSENMVSISENRELDRCDCTYISLDSNPPKISRIENPNCLLHAKAKPEGVTTGQWLPAKLV